MSNGASLSSLSRFEMRTMQFLPIIIIKLKCSVFKINQTCIIKLLYINYLQKQMEVFFFWDLHRSASERCNSYNNDKSTS